MTSRPATGICVAVITAGQVRMETCQSLIACVTEKAVDWMFFYQSGPYLDDARNTCVRTFRAAPFAGCDRLLMVDSDISFATADVAGLAELDLPVVSGVYHSLYPQGQSPVVYDWAETPEGLRTMIPIGAWPDDCGDPLAEVRGVGAGFLMIRRDVIDKFAADYPEPSPWFAEETRAGVHFGEDLGFCLRAADQGIPVVVDRRVQVAHHKTVRLDGR